MPLLAHIDAELQQDECVRSTLGYRPFLVSRSFPKLSAKGALDNNHLYTPSDVAALLNMRLQGQVVPEFDLGHTFPSWGKVVLKPPDYLPVYEHRQHWSTSSRST